MDFLKDFIFSKQEYLIYLGGVMIVAGIIKENAFFTDFYNIITSKIKSKRLVVSLVSLLTGVLPIPGRVTVSAGVLETLAPDKGNVENSKSRSKFGIIDYLATHHYYLWSPLEKTIIIPMAAFSLSYLEMLSYTWILLGITVVYIVWYIFGRMSEDDIILTLNRESFQWKRLIFGAFPLFIGIGLLVWGFKPWWVFGVLVLYYILYSSTYSIKKLNSYIHWNLIATLAIVIIASNLIANYYGGVKAFLESTSALNMATASGFILVSAFAYGASFALGSSGKYAGIIALLGSIYGLQYLTWFISLEYSAYLISPTHKCTHIGRMYFGTPMIKYYRVITVWTVFMLCYGFISIP